MTGWTLRSCNVGLHLGVAQSEVICITAYGKLFTGVIVLLNNKGSNKVSLLCIVGTVYYTLTILFHSEALIYGPIIFHTTWNGFVCLFGLMLYVPLNNFSVMSGRKLGTRNKYRD